MKDENLRYLLSVEDMDPSVRYHRELKRIALFAKNLFTRIYQFEAKLKDVRTYVKNTAHDKHQIYEGYEPVFKVSDIVSRISQLLCDVESDIDVIVTKWYVCRVNVMSCLKWIARVAKGIEKKSGQVPHISDDVSLSKDEQSLYQTAFDILSDLSTRFGADCNESLLKEKEQFQDMIKDLQERISSLKGQNDAKDMQLKKAAKKLSESESKYEDILSKNGDLVLEIERLNKELQKEKTGREDDKKRRKESNKPHSQYLEDRIKQLQKEKEEMNKRQENERKHVSELEEKIKRLERERGRMTERQKYERNKTKELEDRVRQLETEKKETAKSQEESERRLRESEQMLQVQDNLLKQLEYEEFKRQQQQQTSATRVNEKGYGQAVDSSSQVAAAQLTHENPIIPDLSDKYRPTKLSERYSELYDNEWTEAFSEIEDGSGMVSEEGIMKRLRDILLNCYTHCVDTSKKQLDSLCAVLVSPNEHKEKKVASHELINDSSMFVIGLRKQTCSSAIGSIKKEMTSKYPDSRRYPDLKAYLEKCAELCWMMVIQSPPVYIDDTHKPGDRFDKDVFKAYTRPGLVIDFVVWPPVYLHKGGPLLCKGTAQGRE